MRNTTEATGKRIENMPSPKMKRRPSKALDGYLDLVRQFLLRPIRSEKELDRAIAMINSLLDRDRLSPAEEDYPDVLGGLVERYEDKHHPSSGAAARHASLPSFAGDDDRDVTVA